MYSPAEKIATIYQSFVHRGIATGVFGSAFELRDSFQLTVGVAVVDGPRVTVSRLGNLWVVKSGDVEGLDYDLEHAARLALGLATSTYSPQSRFN
jgi:hypothetical protein